MLRLPTLLDDFDHNLDVSVLVRYPLRNKEHHTDFESIEYSLINTVHMKQGRYLDRNIGTMSLLISHDVPLDWDSFDAQSAEMEELFTVALCRLRATDRERMKNMTFIYLSMVKIQPRWRGKGLSTKFIANVLDRLSGEQAFIVILPWPPEAQWNKETQKKVARLQKFYSQFGFAQLWDTRFMYTAPWTLRPPLNKAPAINRYGQ